MRTSMLPGIIHRPGVGTTAGILQKQALELKRLVIEQPILVVVEHGSKLLRQPDGEYLIRAGEAVAIAGGQTIDLINQPAADGSYRALWLVWDGALLAAHALAHPEQPAIRGVLPLRGHDDAWLAAFRRAVEAVGDAALPVDIARHRAAEALLWLGVYGGRFAPAESPTVAVKVRRLIGQDLAREWSAAAVASTLAMSEATLRRRLADEATNLSEILVDTRMSFALNLLQCSGQAVTQIAYHVGYQSPSHFAVRFRQRFGFSPSAIRQRALRA